jgi:hypothetical protein
MEKQCGCFKKSDFQDEQEFNSKEDALQIAQDMCADMNDTFCQKHFFSLVENGNEIIIKMDINDK